MPITHGARLDRLRNLRERVDSEIRVLEAAHAVARRQRAIVSIAASAPASAVRAWAREHGVPVGETGRVSQELREQYLDAATKESA